MLAREHMKHSLNQQLDLQRLSNSGLGRNLTNRLSQQQQLKVPRREAPPADDMAELYGTLKRLVYQEKERRYLLEAKKENAPSCRDKVLSLFTALWESLLEQDQRLAQLDHEQKEGHFINSYEEQLVKLEADVRQHIRIEQQLKLFGESTQQKLEDALRQNQHLKQHISQLNVQLASQRHSRDHYSSVLEDPNASTLQNASTLHNQSNPSNNCSRQFYSKIDRKESELHKLKQKLANVQQRHKRASLHQNYITLEKPPLADLSNQPDRSSLHEKGGQNYLEFYKKIQEKNSQSYKQQHCRTQSAMNQTDKQGLLKQQYQLYQKGVAEGRH